MENLSALLDELYRNNENLPAIEKVAEDQFYSSLHAEDQVSSGPDLSHMSNEELLVAFQEKIAHTSGAVEVPVEETFEVSDHLDNVGGRVMAHAMMHEFRNIKVAMANGLCRVCKEQPMDIQGYSVCSACHE